MTGRVSIFVKTPGLSPIKTRLSSVIGVDRAKQFYQLSLAATRATLIDFLHRQPEWDAEWRPAEEQGVEHFAGGPFRVSYAGRGGLGLSMERAFHDALNAGRASLLIGADIPQLDQATLCEAVQQIKRGRSVIGPARDGGFYLIGGSVVLPIKAWRDTAYSRHDTLDDFLKNAQGVEFGFVRPLSDVDEVDDLAACVAEMPEEPNDAQLRLIDWIEAL